MWPILMVGRTLIQNLRSNTWPCLVRTHSDGNHLAEVLLSHCFGTPRSRAKPSLCKGDQSWLAFGKLHMRYSAPFSDMSPSSRRIPLQSFPRERDFRMGHPQNVER